MNFERDTSWKKILEICFDFTWPSCQNRGDHNCQGQFPIPTLFSCFRVHLDRLMFVAAGSRPTGHVAHFFLERPFLSCPQVESLTGTPHALVAERRNPYLLYPDLNRERIVLPWLFGFSTYPVLELPTKSRTSSHVVTESGWVGPVIPGFGCTFN